MRVKTALLTIAILSWITYSLPLYAANTHEYHLEERTVIQIPVVGKISTLTHSYFSGCKFMESTTIRMHNVVVKMISDSEGKKSVNLLYDLCDKVRWQYDEISEEYFSKSFEKIREERTRGESENDSHIDMESDQYDIEDLPQMTHDIMGYEKNINGFKARKVVTRVFREKAVNPIVIEEYYSADIKPLEKILDTRKQISKEMGEGEDHIEGVPSFIEVIYNRVLRDQELDRPEGEVVRLVISMLDDDNDVLFTMNYDVLSAEKNDFKETHFSLE